MPQEKIAHRGSDVIGRLDQDGMLQSVEDDELGIRQGVGDEPVEARIASAVDLAGEHETRADHLVSGVSSTWRCWGLDRIGLHLHERIGVPALDQRAEPRLDAFVFHRGENAMHLRADLCSAARGCTGPCTSRRPPAATARSRASRDASAASSPSVSTAVRVGSIPSFSAGIHRQEHAARRPAPDQACDSRIEPCIL